MFNRRPHCVWEELGVLISLVVSLGMVILTAVGWWLWKTVPDTIEAMWCMRSLEIP